MPSLQPLRINSPFVSISYHAWGLITAASLAVTFLTRAPFLPSPKHRRPTRLSAPKVALPGDSSLQLPSLPPSSLTLAPFLPSLQPLQINPPFGPIIYIAWGLIAAASLAATFFSNPQLAASMAVPFGLAVTVGGYLVGHLVPRQLQGVLPPVAVTALVAHLGAVFHGQLRGLGYEAAQGAYMSKVGLIDPSNPSFQPTQT